MPPALTSGFLAETTRDEYPCPWVESQRELWYAVQLWRLPRGAKRRGCGAPKASAGTGWLAPAFVVALDRPQPGLRLAAEPQVFQRWVAVSACSARGSTGSNARSMVTSGSAINCLVVALAILKVEQRA